MEPWNNQISAAERSIQMFKNHFVSGLASTGKSWPLQLWDQLTTQALITAKSVYKQLHDHVYDWDAHPLAPPGTRAIIYKYATTCMFWDPRGMVAWTIVQSLQVLKIPLSRNTLIPHFWIIWSVPITLPDARVYPRTSRKRCSQGTHLVHRQTK